MSLLEVEERLTRLEAEFEQMKAKLPAETNDALPWWDQIYGVFKDDSLFDEAEKQGRAWRESQRPEDAREADVSS